MTKVINENQIPAEVIADSIVAIAEGMRKLNSTRLTRDAIIVLLCKKSGQSKTAVEDVLYALDNLEKHWLKPLPVKKP